MKLSWNRLALTLGVFVLALMAIDGLNAVNREAMASYGVGQGPLVMADSAAALFMVGLVLGVILGIGVFFAYLAWREKQYAQQDDEIAKLLEEVAAEEEAHPVLYEENVGDEVVESNDPWERPVDWWKRCDDDY